jgi:hypothetical protein
MPNRASTGLATRTSEAHARFGLMNDDRKPAEPDWNAYRARVRGRAQRQFSAVIASAVFIVGLFVVVARVLAPQDYPVGDFRNDMVFRLGFGGFLLVLTGSLLVATIRRLRRDD